jgi:type II secretion system protein I
MTLIELVVAVAVLALGLSAAWGSIGAARRSAGAQADRVLALEVAQNRAAALRLGLPDLPGVERMGGIDWTLATTRRATEGGLVETELTVTAPGRAGARLVVWLPAPP